MATGKVHRPAQPGEGRTGIEQPAGEAGGGRLNFIEQIIAEHNASGRFGARVHTRFPPEPNGYLHIGHAKSICLNFGLAAKYGGLCNLRFDDTNPVKEEAEYVDAIKEDIRWLGFDWANREYYASDYFEQLYEWAEKLIQDGKAYVCEQSPEQMREARGTLTSPGIASQSRERSPAENLDLFRKMRAGEFPDGSKTLRAKIDMGHPNLNMRDPVMYRILRAEHHRTGNDWCIYPMYDFTHGQSDSIEGITHSVCTLEFENHRPLYDWYLDALGIHHPQQIEFARLNLSYTLTSKRKLLRLVEEGHVSGWDDPRMPTLSGMRRRGIPPESIRLFAERIGVAKFNSIIDMTVLENTVREHLNLSAPRAMAVLKPLKVVITNYPEDQEEYFVAINNPEDPEAGTRKVPFSRTLWIEEDDFREEAPKKFFRLKPGKEVRLRYAYVIRCDEVIKNDSGQIVELRCSYDPETRDRQPTDRRVKGVLHWVSAQHALTARVRLYDRLFTTSNPDDAPPGLDYLHNLNPDSLQSLEDCKLEPSLGDAKPGSRYQFERLGYFVCDSLEPGSGAPLFNRIVALRDSWARLEKRRI